MNEVIKREGKSKSGGSFSLTVCDIEITKNGVKLNSEATADFIQNTLAGDPTADEQVAATDHFRSARSSLPYGSG